MLEAPKAEDCVPLAVLELPKAEACWAVALL
ncbi:hypothetical protein NK6_229 [Bradyrhizobium diazoefficiens]|uniref:Uncharacterized protein n=1 Tax=Bradyrhizobium diazoefficiens TaxID=1355477 RepID=A0A0E4BJM0_9BRAD|nr:hypothetical protein NK6_229 [Bradyrhizobium diazoefficiens]